MPALHFHVYSHGSNCHWGHWGHIDICIAEFGGRTEGRSQSCPHPKHKSIFTSWLPLLYKPFEYRKVENSKSNPATFICTGVSCCASNARTGLLRRTMTTSIWYTAQRLHSLQTLTSPQFHWNVFPAERPAVVAEQHWGLLKSPWWDLKQRGGRYTPCTLSPSCLSRLNWL